MADKALTDQALVDVLTEYLRILQEHPSAEEMLSAILTDDFETGFLGGYLWQGIDGLRDFLSQRDGFFDEHHEIDRVLENRSVDDHVEARTRLHFFLRRWEAPSPHSGEFTGACFHTWRVRAVRRPLAGSGAARRAVRGSERQRRAAVRDAGRGAEPLALDFAPGRIVSSSSPRRQVRHRPDQELHGHARQQGDVHRKVCATAVSICSNTASVSF